MIDAQSLMYILIGIGVFTLCITLSILVIFAISTLSKINKTIGNAQYFIEQPARLIQTGMQFINNLIK